MAEVIVSPLVEQLTKMITTEAHLLLGVGDQIISLRNQLEWIRCFLTDAEKKSKDIQVVEIWVRQVRELAYDAEDIIDTFNLHVERRKNATIVWRIIGFWNKLMTLHKTGMLIEQFNKRSTEISTYKSQYNIHESVSMQDSSHRTERLVSRLATRRTTPLVEEQPRRRVMSIIGMGGLGKTTLAKLVYGKREVENHFDVCAWIYVSPKYRVRDLLSSCLKQVRGSITIDERSHIEKMDDGELKIELHKYLQGKRYLVVIDNIWNIDTWERISASLPENQNGSRVLITTRNKEVAIHADQSTKHHELRLMNKDESWDLFCAKVFSSSGSCPPQLVHTGKRIVEKCGGLPLAIVMRGGILIGKERTNNAWSRVLACVDWQLNQDSNPSREILALSYTDLPYYLKSCFLYLGLFPKDFDIKVGKLTLLWIAEGFVQVRGEEPLEDVAEDYLEELIQRSLIQVTQRKYHRGPIETCRVNDLLRDFAITEAKNIRFLDILGNKMYPVSARPRRLGIHSCDTSMDVNHSSASFSKLRSILFFDVTFQIDMWKSTFGGRTKMLKVLVKPARSLFDINFVTLDVHGYLALRQVSSLAVHYSSFFLCVHQEVECLVRTSRCSGEVKVLEITRSINSQ
ncbi:hypothetical protein AQUCO_11800039v1 [Aquilegia coerulea]|uniref:AAA+ ATPase domain-containing protein n=1 Tax=Aquilegia coerulea TaxID=218851 RepID=A0A2G5C2A2_AQUCA|nr:hypothetical protein AQUCO_11800039v1 [Aquilegia coerulea]